MQLRYTRCKRHTSVQFPSSRWANSRASLFKFPLLCPTSVRLVVVGGGGGGASESLGSSFLGFLLCHVGMGNFLFSIGSFFISVMSLSVLSFTASSSFSSLTAIPIAFLYFSISSTSSLPKLSTSIFLRNLSLEGFHQHGSKESSEQQQQSLWTNIVVENKQWSSISQ